MSSSLSPIRHDSNLNGPVPTGFEVPNVPVGRKEPSEPTLPASAWYLTRAAGLAIANDGSARAARNEDEGRVRMMRAVDAFTILHPRYKLLSGPGFPVAGFAYPPNTVTQ